QDFSPGMQGLLDRGPSNPAIDPLAGAKSGGRRIAGRAPKSSRLHAGGAALRQGPDGDAQQLSSTWRSPTAFLVKAPGNDLLVTVRNREDSLVRIDSR